MATIPLKDLGWMAGVIDLKGKVVRKKNTQRATPQLVLYVETKEQKVIQKLSKLTGTNPEVRKSHALKEWMRRGCMEHCPEAHVHVEDDPTMMPMIARWTTTGASAAVILHNLIPYMVSSEKMTAYLNEMLENTVFSGQGSGMVLSSITRLSKLGWKLPDSYRDILTKGE